MLSQAQPFRMDLPYPYLVIRTTGRKARTSSRNCKAPNFTSMVHQCLNAVLRLQIPQLDKSILRA